MTFDATFHANRLQEVLSGHRANSATALTARQAGVLRTSEFLRIETLPRREWTEEEGEALSLQLTAALKTPAGEQTLRPVQAIALLEMFQNKGFFGPIRVGGGKTLITLLAPVVMGFKRPVLILPAKLLKKTEREVLILRRHWRIPNTIRLVSTNILGRAKHAKLLKNYKPDGIIIDEVHKFKSKHSVCTKQLMRHPHVPTIGVSGTITSRSIKDYAHIVDMCLGGGSPLPRKFTELENWANALDEKTNPVNRVAPGVLLDFATEEERATLDPIVAARRGYARRLMQTPGVVKSDDSRLGCSLSIETVLLPTPGNPSAEAAFEQLRRDWEVPDGHVLMDAVQVWRHARELALGFYYRWNPRPPEAWLAPRRAWAAACRQIVQNNRRALDSEYQVKLFMAEFEAHYKEERALLAAWETVEPTFTPNTEAVWFDDTVLHWVADWGTKHRGIIWTEHTAFAEALARVSGMPFYHRQGLNAAGHMIEDATGTHSIIASVGSNFEGRNLQHAFDDNLVVSPVGSGWVWEQKLGRTHRDGHKSDEVSCSVLINCLEHCISIHQAIKDAHYHQDSTGQEYRLCYADKDLVTLDSIMSMSGYRWTK